MDEWKLGLRNAPAEIVSVITGFVSGSDVLALWMCGNKRLNYCMCEQGGVQRLHVSFSYRIRDLRGWPTVIPYFKKLVSLGVSVGGANVIGGNALEAFAEWPKTIKELSLSFRNAEKCWVRCNSIADLFPVLEKLTLDGWSGFGAASLKKLPPTLISLELSTSNSLSAETIRDFLPPSIEHLMLPGATKLDPSVGEWLPRNLKTFSVAYTPVWMPADILALPQTLTSLALHFDSHSASETLRSLPQTLKSLQLRCFWGSNAHFTVPFPPQLETLLLRDGDVSVDLETLPDTLTRLELGHLSANIGHTFDFRLPPRLRTFWVSQLPPDFANTFQESIILELPQTLTELTIQSAFPISDTLIAALPKYLRLLHLDSITTVTGRAFKSLPRYLHSLELGRITDVKDEEIADLPRWIDHLKLSHAKALTDAFAKHLPRGLRLLNVHENCNFTFKCLPDMPTHIYEIDLGQTGVGSKYESDLRKRGKVGC